VAVGDPFAAPGPRVRIARFETACRVPRSGQPDTFFFGGVLIQSQVLLPDDAPIAPLVSPPRMLLVDGADARLPRTIAQAPVVSWSPPSVGTVNRYVVSITAVEFSQRATFVVAASPSPRLAVPPSFFVPNREYVIGVSAYTTPGDPERVPFRYGFPFARADTVSAVMTVSP
jgi:hypothetical protein